MSACARGPAEPLILAPGLPPWPAEAQIEAAEELDACRDCDAIERALSDYIGLRDAIRALAP